MATPYNHKEIEKKWRHNWEISPINKDTTKPKYYCLDMFPYPSGSGLHVGHWRGYVISDVWSRYKMLHGYHIIHPMGWDAFGLPAENYAIKMKTHPAKSTADNIANIKRQINEIAALYDWDMEVNTTDPKFYKWTQWIFVQMFKKGLAYQKEMPINWCPSCKTGLANEEVVNGCCERCGAEVTKKNLKQWMLKITAYADRLHNLRTLQYQSPAKQVEKARETMDIYAPIAHRLGISKIKVELDDLSMKYLMPEVYKDLTAQIDARMHEREAYIKRIVADVKKHIDNAHLDAEIDGRVKHLFSIYKKMKNQNKTLDQIYDIFAVRIKVETVRDCYSALGIIHEMYKPIPGRFKDYIAMPKSNMYQSYWTLALRYNL